MQITSTERLELVFKIIEDWWGGLLPADQALESEIAEVEERLGVTLTGELRRWYLAASNLSNRLRCFGGSDYIFSVKEIYSRGDFLVIAVENESCWSALIRLEDLNQNDPPIYFYEILGEEAFYIEAYLITPQGASFTEFVLAEITDATSTRGQFVSRGVFSDSIKDFANSKQLVIYESENLGRMYFDQRYFFWNHLWSTGGKNTQVSIKKLSDAQSFIDFIPKSFVDDWVHEHYSSYDCWGHSLNSECTDLTLPLGRNNLPACHFNDSMRYQVVWPDPDRKKETT